MACVTASASLSVHNPDLPSVGSSSSTLVAWAVAVLAAGLALIGFGRRRTTPVG